MSASALPDADASRPRSGILTPTSDGTLNLNGHNGSSASSEGRKKTRAATVAMDHLLNPSIALKPNPTNLHVQPRVLQPLMLLPREHLPLSCLDLQAPQGDLPQSRFFESHIKILDLESRMASSPRVLLARSESKRTTYALERHDNSLYSVCKLGAWVEIESLAQHATAICQDRVNPPKPREEATSFGAETTALTTPQTHKDEKKKRVAIEAIQSLVRKRARSQSVSTLDTPIVTVPALLPSSDDNPVLSSSTMKQNKTADASIGTDVSQQQTAESIFSTIRNHYFEALYRSKGSLAYFAKGPLSRARSAFHLDLESDLDMNDLLDFLKGLLLTTVQVDKKYRETIPELVARASSKVDSSDEGQRKRRRSKKMKLGKDALYPGEDESIRRWWAANKPEPKDDEEAGVSMEHVKSHASLLRTRETQLQMIVILEILALEPLRPQEQTTDAGLPSLPGATVAPEQMAPPPPPKKRNKHNLPMLLDVHTDRLTIWQSMASDVQLLLQDSQAPSPSLPNELQQKASLEPLKDFCVDVIVPFYSSRLPQLCDSLSQKLGGPVILSPPKPRSKSKSLKRSSSKHMQRPGAATRRTALQKEPRTLERALSFEQQHRRSVSRGPNAIEDLMRATSAAMPAIKREDSDSNSLKKLAKVEPGSRSDGRASLSRSSSFAGLDDQKANKKAKIDAELRDAISNLRKPNREVVGKDMAEAAERKVSTVVPAKKPRKMIKPVAGPSIQVKATPANQRFKDAFASMPEVPPDVPLPSTEEIIPPSSVGASVPSTGPRNGFRNVGPSSTTLAADVVGHTPIKASSRSSFLRRPAAEEPAIPPSSPILARKAMAPVSPMVPASVVKPRAKTSFGPQFDDIPDTPVKKPAPHRFLSGQEKDTEQGKKKQVSIYQTLGWDDDELDDLL